MKSNFVYDLIVLNPPVGHFYFCFSFLVRKIPFAGIELTSQRVRGLRGASELPGRPAYLYVYFVIAPFFLSCLFLKKNQNAPRPSEHPPVRGKKCQNV